ncbi:TIGR01777 family oxidoreductase [Arcicella rigui]|uniref:TIGR01777 family oxidoreductase n=1 Tax=Arcicella rigui TaxID=797020 RepID=A0ABU5QD38_9BACT|nr:TIGR01777 family oxidoreductase [Arcicella rigui]MEA5140761.1 TIGR01777 family oxidoreductase [Arcicella rigui]
MNVLITGGSGLVGTRLTQILLANGFTVSHLSRKPTNTTGKVKIYHWDIENGIIDEKALLEADYLVHLAGAGIADEKWTEERKKEIIDSRTKSLRLITASLQTLPHKIQAFTSASGIGFYGADTGEEHISEQYTAGDDFVAECCTQWEAVADEIQNLGIRTSKLRIGIVLSTKGGALPKILLPVRFGVGAALGTGKQYQSWIHIDDLCELFIKSLTDESMNGVYNAVAPKPVTNYELTKTSAEILKRPFFMPNVPAWTLKLVFGEMSIIVLGGNYILNQRISLETDFQYQYSTVKKALESLL